MVFAVVGHEKVSSTCCDKHRFCQINVPNFLFKKLTSIGVGCNAALHSVVTNFLKLYFVCIEVGTR